MPRRTTAGDIYALTGGTGDVNPQFLTFDVIQSGADTTTTEQVNLPIDRMSQKGGRAQIIEVLKVFFQVDYATEGDSRVSIYLSTSSFGTTNTNWAEPRVFAMHFEERFLVASGTFQRDQPYCMDLTDGAGHGYLIATDSIYAQVSTSNSGAATLYRVKILYRWKNVSLSEYIGVVQSQS